MDRMMALQATVDDEFRAELMTDPIAFDTEVSALPDPIEQPDQESLRSWTTGAASEIYACPATHHCIHTHVCRKTY
ncbi:MULTISPECIES: cinnamycin family lantibiotic [unclassified Microbispora]|uniref:cinnamycin family lantibiotic n=1 Tax=unclassified Microbispora TaxID=2614687 RepID=UPI001472F734|nr:MULTISPECIES: cinnamycin family lantibiotic [unclassified Microbispora]